MAENEKTVLNESDRLVAYVSLEKDISQIEGQINACEGAIRFFTEYRERLTREYVMKRKELEDLTVVISE